MRLDDIEKFWQEFLAATNKDSTTRYIEHFHFDLTQEIANDLLAMVLAGVKKATAGSLLAYECKGDRVPQVGDYSIVTDWEGNPHCVIETTNVTILPFSEITYDICKREGEDDTLESWQKSHRRFFTEEGEELGYEFVESMPVVFEDFRVVYKKGE
ncbi:MAG: ASCH domain-containing protein [Defluviitaleaceae bacterium]|nr:ASCH domain-containing protein [Defluviitaleaceae bacterium]